MLVKFEQSRMVQTTRDFELFDPPKKGFLKTIIDKALSNFVINCYFVNNCLIKVRISKSFCTYVTHIIVIICRKQNFVSTHSSFS